MRIYRVKEDSSSGYTGFLNATSKWGLPGLESCPTCGMEGGILGVDYPCVDLSDLPEEELKKLSDPWPVPFEEFDRLRKRVLPFLPKDVPLLVPGTEMGPTTGKGTGSFGSLYMSYGWLLYAQREAVEELKEAGVRGLQYCPAEVRFRGKNPPRLMQFQPELGGRFHAGCLPRDLPPPCPSCGCQDFQLPETYWLDAASLPEHLDMFRPARRLSSIFVTERFVEAAQRLALDGVLFQEVEAR
jgi:uncharacterized double-CXXCG motif protein